VAALVVTSLICGDQYAAVPLSALTFSASLLPHQLLCARICLPPVAMSLHFQASVRPTNAGLGNCLASTAIPPLSRSCQMPSQCVSNCQFAMLLPSLQTRRQAKPCIFTSHHCNKHLRCQHLLSCQASAVGQGSMASQPESPNR